MSESGRAGRLAEALHVTPRQTNAGMAKRAPALEPRGPFLRARPSARKRGVDTKTHTAEEEALDTSWCTETLLVNVRALRSNVLRSRL